MAFPTNLPAMLDSPDAMIEDACTDGVPKKIHLSDLIPKEKNISPIPSKPSVEATVPSSLLGTGSWKTQQCRMMEYEGGQQMFCEILGSAPDANRRSFHDMAAEKREPETEGVWRPARSRLPVFQNLATHAATMEEEDPPLVTEELVVVEVEDIEDNKMVAPEDVESVPEVLIPEGWELCLEDTQSVVSDLSCDDSCYGLDDSATSHHHLFQFPNMVTFALAPIEAFTSVEAAHAEVGQ